MISYPNNLFFKIPDIQTPTTFGGVPIFNILVAFFGNLYVLKFNKLIALIYLVSFFPVLRHFYYKRTIGEPLLLNRKLLKIDQFIYRKTGTSILGVIHE